MGSENKVRNCREIGVNLQKIVNRLMANDNLVNLLFYQDKDPLAQPTLTDEQKKSKIFNKRIKMTPKLDPQENAQSTVAVLVTRAQSIGSNTEFTNITVTVEIFVPVTQWLIKDSNLRPYAIMGEIQASLNGKVINGLGTMTGGDFDFNFTSDEMTSFIQTFRITNYD